MALASWSVCALIHSVNDRLDTKAELTSNLGKLPAGAGALKVEANLLRYPLFALSTKGLKTLDGIECRGKVRRDGAVREYLLRVSRNTSCLYPGPLARRVHFALLSIAADRG